MLFADAVTFVQKSAASLLVVIGITQAHADIGVEWTHPDYGKTVHAALGLLRERAPEDYKIIVKYIGRIKEVEAWHLSGMAAYENPPTYYLSITSVRVSVTWTAGAIAHDACHSRQYHDYRRAHKVKWVPEKVWTGQKAELECIGYQITVMQQIGAPADEIRSLRRLDGLHYLEAERRREADRAVRSSGAQP